MPAIAWTVIKNAIHTWIRVTSGLAADRIRWAGQNAPEVEASTTLPWILIGRFTWANPGSDWVQYVANPFVFDDKVVTLDAGTDLGTSTAHGLETRDGPVRLVTTGSLAGTNLAIDTDYWVIRDSANTLKFATSFLNADDGVFIDIAGAGTGTHSIVDTPSTVRAGQELKEVVRGARRVTFDIQCFPPQPAIGGQIPDDSDPVAVLSDVVAKLSLGSVTGPLQEAGIGILDPGSPRAIEGVTNSVYFEPRAVMTVAFSTTSEVEGTETIIEYVGVDEDPGSTDFTVDLTTPPNEP